ncbi:MAG: hypothetical protein HRU40_21565 [Saprospiraceae bacterium]|nr:hypothetical protein [Saprospiraceae bacterium]
MRLLIIILVLILNESCTSYSDKEELTKYYEKNIDTESVIQDLNDNAITRYDDLGYSIDKHWFDKDGELTLYTFYNRFYETNKAALKVRFNGKNEIIEFEGEPFYVSSNLVDNDTLVIDTVKAYVYLANSPFLNPEVKILTENLNSDNQYLSEDKNLNYVLYFEDYPDSFLQNIVYSFYYSTNIADFHFRDSVVYSIHIKRN